MQTPIPNPVTTKVSTTSTVMTHQSSTNPGVWKALTPKASDQRKRTVIAKRGYKVRVLDQPMPTTTALTTATTSTQTQTTGSTARTIPVTVHKLATGQFIEASSPTAKP